MRQAVGVLGVLALVLTLLATGLVPSNPNWAAAEPDVCPSDGDWTKVDNESGTAEGDWGSLSWSGSTVNWDINKNWSLDLCVKSGADSASGGDKTWQQVVSGEGSHTTGGEKDISHVSYRPIPLEPTVTVTVDKDWTGDDHGDATATFTIDGTKANPGDTIDLTDQQGQEVTINEDITGLPEDCTATSDTPFTYTVPEAGDDDVTDTITITNTVDCEEPDEPEPEPDEKVGARDEEVGSQEIDTPTRVDAGGGGMATGSQGPIGLVSLMAFLFGWLVLTVMARIEQSKSWLASSSPRG